MSADTTPNQADLRARLPELMLRDQRRLGRRLDGLRKTRDPARRAATLARVAEEVEAAVRRVELRRSSLPPLKYPEELPVTQRREDILAAIRDNQVVIVAGETGSGKTTQIPKMCLELGRGVTGLIGHTQPRRIAARTVAERVAEEIGTPLGETVGWKVRFTDQVGDRTLVKIMTDGILLAEIQHDRLLAQYDTIIIDEAHERSLNIDFLLGYLARLLPRRPDLKVVITSATIDPERFSRHFGDAPIVEVSGRTFPVEVRYRPLVDPEDPDADPDRDQTQGIVEAVEELSAEGPGDVLVFLSGEREIRDTADALNAANLRNTEVLPLYARLSSAEQHRVFQPHTGRRVVLATNVAETSLTVPGIKYVVDPGTARISRYSNRLKVQRLPIEAVSQASANQRKGRCGRTSDGICIRLYSEDDFLARPEFTDPEILRTNLASVILQMAAADLGEMVDFPFIEPPDKRHIADGTQLLHELGALDPAQTDPAKRLTPLGRQLAQLPVDPRLARMVIEADKNGCLAEVMVIAAALSIQDPRERPQDKQQAAAEKHARFADPDSDFISYLNLWNHLRERQRELSSNRFRRECKAEFLNYLRIREWQDIHSQLRQVAKQLGITPNETPAEPRNVHMSLLSGLLSHIGFRDPAGKEYVGARNAKFAVFPGSALFKKPPRWVMAAELVETSRLWGRIAARIEPEWIEPIAEHLVRRNHSEPHWEAKQGSVVAMERVTLYGLPIVVSRKVQYGRIDPELSRDLFIRHALVEGDWQTRHHFFRDNRKLLDEVEDLEHRFRRRDIVVDDETLFRFYDERVPAEVVSGRHFDSWWKKTRHEHPDLLTFTKAMLVNDSVDVDEDAFPDALRQHGLTLPLSYRFEPGRDDDGVTARVPIAVLNQLNGDALSVQVPGLREEVVTALIRSLPKPLRRNFVPVPDFAKAVVRKLAPTEESLPDAVGRELRALTGVLIPRDAWQLDAVPAHLKTTFQVVDGDKTLATGKDLGALKQQLKSQLRESLTAATVDLARRGLTSWTIGTLPKVARTEQNGLVVTAYPALVDEGATVAVRMLDTAVEQRAAMWTGTRKLVLLNVASPTKHVVRSLSNQAKLALSHNPHGGVPALLADCVDAAADHLIAQAGGPAWTEAGFTRLREHVRTRLNATVVEVLDAARKVVQAWNDVERRLGTTRGPIFVEPLADIREQLAGLVFPGFITATGVARLPHLERYLRGVDRRLDKLPERPDRDTAWMHTVQDLEDAYHDAVQQRHPAARDTEEVRAVKWMIEELRVSYFAQTLGSAGSISDKRVQKAIAALIP